MNKKFIKRVSILMTLSFVVSNTITNFCFNKQFEVKAASQYSFDNIDSSNYDKPQNHSSQGIYADIYTDTPGYTPSDPKIPKGWAFNETVLFPTNRINDTNYMIKMYHGAPTLQSYLNTTHYSVDSSNPTASNWIDNYWYPDETDYPNSSLYGSQNFYYSPVTILKDNCLIRYKWVNAITNYGTTLYNTMPNYSSLSAGANYVADYHYADTTYEPVGTAPTADFYFNSGSTSATVQAGDTLKVIDGKGYGSGTTYSDKNTKYWSTYWDGSGTIYYHNGGKGSQPSNGSSLPQSFTYNNAIITGSSWSVYNSSGQNVNNLFNASSGLKNQSNDGAYSEMDLTIGSDVPAGTYTVHHSVKDNWGNPSGDQTRTFTVSQSPQQYDLTVHYLDQTGNEISGTEVDNAPNPYTPVAPNGYSLTGNYRTSATGSDSAFNYNNGTQINVDLSTSNQTIYVVCSAIISQSKLNAHYVDADTGADITDVSNVSNPYTPHAPQGYSLTGNYRTSSTGTDISYTNSISPSSGVSDIYIMCKKVNSEYTLNVTYVDENNNNNIIGYGDTVYYDDSSTNLKHSNGSEFTTYLPDDSKTPAGYTLDTSKYFDPSLGYFIEFDSPVSMANENGHSGGKTANLQIYCTSNGGNVNPTPNPPVATTGTVIERYFINGVEQTADENTILNVTPGSHSYIVDKSYSGYVCNNSPVTLNVYAGQIYHCDFYFSAPSATAGTVIERYYLDNVEQTSDEHTISNVTPGTHIYNVDKSYPGYNCVVSTESVTVTAGNTSYADFYYSDAPTTGTVVKRYYLAGVEQTADEETVANVTPGSHTYTCDKTYAGYTFSQSSVTTTVYAGQTSYCNFYFNKNSVPPTCSIDAPANVHSGKSFTVVGLASDPQGESLIYTWASSDSQSITGNQGTLTMGTKPITLTLYVTDTEGLKSPVATKTIQPANNPPTVTLNLPQTITLGDDLNLNAVGSDLDGDPITYSWNLPNGATGTVTGNSGSVRFMNKADVGKQKSFTVNVADPYGGTGSATASTTVVAPKPTVSISQSGTLKENRKVTLSETSDGGSKSFLIDNTKTQWSFYDSNNNPINVTNTADSGIVESLDSTTGTSGMNVIFTKAGTYTAKCTVTNTNGDTAIDSKTIVITPDLAPIADFSLNNTVVYRDANNHDRATMTLTDNSTSNDGDSISKRVWVYAFDSNNNGTADDEQWYVYNLDYTDQFGDHWQPIADKSGNVVKGIQALNILNDGEYLNKINSGNLTTVQLVPKNIYKDFHGQWESHVGKYHYKEFVQESFGQDTIQSLISSNDYKIGISQEKICDIQNTPPTVVFG